MDYSSVNNSTVMGAGERRIRSDKKKTKVKEESCLEKFLEKYWAKAIYKLRFIILPLTCAWYGYSAYKAI